MLKCWIFADGIPIGWTILHIHDRSMGVIGGIFHPTPAYHGVQAHMQATFDALSDQMPLMARTEQGEQLDPVAGIRIADHPELDEIEVTVCGLHWYVVQRHFGESPSVS